MSKPESWEQYCLVRAGKLIRERRKQRKMSEAALAALCGYKATSKAIISELERGRANPPLTRFLRICEELGLSMGQLFPDLKVPQLKRKLTDQEIQVLNYLKEKDGTGALRELPAALGMKEAHITSAVGGLRNLGLLKVDEKRLEKDKKLLDRKMELTILGWRVNSDAQK